MRAVRGFQRRGTRSPVTPQSNDLDPSESVQSFFGAEVRRLRALAGMSQEDLARKVFVTRALVGMIENAIRMPSRDFAHSADKALDGDGCLTRLWPLVNRAVYPKWFRAYTDLEEAATAIRSYEPQVVDGLFQTEEYARAVLSGVQTKDLEGLVAARMER